MPAKAIFDARQLADEHAAKTSTDPFPFVGMDGETYELPPAGSLTTGALRQLMSGDLTGMYELVDDDTAAALDELPVEVFNALGEAWMEAGEAAGKSASPSRAARRSAGKRSKQTSPSGASS